MFDPNTRVLIVDDMNTMRIFITNICKELGFKNLTEAKDGTSAWKAITEATPPFGLVITDWNMPNKNGLELLKQIRGDKKFKSLPVIMVTAEAEQQQIKEALLSGVNNYVVKPFTADILKERLKAVHQKLNPG